MVSQIGCRTLRHSLLLGLSATSEFAALLIAPQQFTGLGLRLDPDRGGVVGRGLRVTDDVGGEVVGPGQLGCAATGVGDDRRRLHHLADVEGPG